MPQFNAGEVVIGITAKTNSFEKKMRFVERHAARTGLKSGKLLARELQLGLNAKQIGSKLEKGIETGFRPGNLGQKGGVTFQTKFNAAAKGVGLGTIFSGVGLGLKIAELAFGAISASIKKAEEREAQFELGMQSLNATLSENSLHLSETARLNELVGNTALSASDKIALLQGEYVALGDRLKEISRKDKLTRIFETVDNSGVLFDQLADKKKQLTAQENKVIRGNAGADGLKDLNKLKSEIKSLESQIRAAGKDVLDILKTESPKAIRAKLLADGLRDQFALRQKLMVAQLRSDVVAAQSISDDLKRSQLRNQFIRANIDEYDELSRTYVEDQKKARQQGELKRQSLRQVAKDLADVAAVEAQHQAARNAEIAQATALFNSSRTAVENYTASLIELSELESKSETDPELGGASGREETFQRQRIAALVRFAQVSMDAIFVLAEFERFQKEGLITSIQAVDVLEKLNDILGITADKERAAAEALKEHNKKLGEKAFLVERGIDRELELARLANDDTEIRRLERKLELERKIDELVNRGGLNVVDAADQANREVAEEDVAAARGVFRSGFSDGLRAAIEGDLGSFLEQKLQDLASNMFDRAVENLADAVFDQLSQIAPGFLGQITGVPTLPTSLNPVSGSASTAVGGVANQAVNQAANAGTQAATGAGTSAAITGALTTGGATLATSIGTAMATGGASASAAIGTSMTAAGTAVAAQIAAAMATGGAGKGLGNFAGAFASGGIIGSKQFGLVGENGSELVSAGSGPIRITPLDGGLSERFKGISTAGLESRGSNQQGGSNIVMNIAGVKDLASFVKSQGSIESDMAAALRRAQSDF